MDSTTNAEMGLLENLLPGGFLMLFGLWWMVMTTHEYLMSKIPDRVSRRKPQFTSKTWFPIPCRRVYSYPVESIIKVILSIIAGFLEICYGQRKIFDKSGKVVAANVIYFAYATFFAMFGLTGVMELLLRVKKLKLPHTSGHMTLILAYLTEGLLSYFHSQNDILQNGKDKEKAEAYMHILVYCLALTSAAVTCLEIWNPKSFQLSFVRCYLTLLQGTWLLQLAYVLFNKMHWGSATFMLVPILFAWHMFSALVFSLMMYCAVSYSVCKYRKKQDGLYDKDSFNSKRDTDSIPLSIVINGNAGNHSDDTETGTDILYP